MFTLNMVLDIFQFVALAALSIANGVIAYSVFKIQKDRNTPKLVMYIESFGEEEQDHDDDRALYAVHVQNVGLVPALNVRIVADIEEWRDGRPVRSKFHDRYDAFSDRHVILRSQEQKIYELPWMEGWSLIITMVASCSNGSSDSMHFMVGNEPLAYRAVSNDKRRKKAIKGLKSGVSWREREPRNMRMELDLKSLKDYVEDFTDNGEDARVTLSVEDVSTPPAGPTAWIGRSLSGNGTEAKQVLIP